MTALVLPRPTMVVESRADIEHDLRCAKDLEEDLCVEILMLTEMRARIDQTIKARCQTIDLNRQLQASLKLELDRSDH